MLVPEPTVDEKDNVVEISLIPTPILAPETRIALEQAIEGAKSGFELNAILRFLQILFRHLSTVPIDHMSQTSKATSRKTLSMLSVKLGKVRVKSTSLQSNNKECHTFR